MTFWTAFAEQLPTLALVSLGASETLIGVQSGLRLGLASIQLPGLRLISWFPKRQILMAGNVLALWASVPLLFFDVLVGVPHGWLPLAIVFGALAFTALGLDLGDLVWFPLLRAYVEPDRIGRYFGVMRTSWHAAVIVFLVGGHWWLTRHENGFALLFRIAWALGLLRLALVWRLPERSELGGERLRARDALALVRHDPRVRSYTIGICWHYGVRTAALPFALVMLRRALGFSNSAAIETTIAIYVGGIASLYLWGAVIDRLGPYVGFRSAALGMAGLYLGLAFIQPMGAATSLFAIGFFFAHSLLAQGFAVADTRLLFELAPPEAPSKILVVTAVIEGVCCGVSPAIAGAVLDPLLARASEPLPVYHGFFAAAALLMSLSFVPMRRFRVR
jgi:predicted MFS family arabinose efflux permease